MEANCSREDEPLLSSKMRGNFLLPELDDFSLPGGAVHLSRLMRALDANAQRQRVLVLSGERDQILIAQHALLKSKIRHGFNGNIYRFRRRRSKRKPIGAHALPLLHQQSIRSKKLANAETTPADNILENWDQHRECIFAEYSASSDMRHVLGFRHRDGETIADVYMQHDVHVRAAIAGVNDLIGTDFQVVLQLIKNRNLAVAGSRTNNAFDLSVCRIAEFGAEDVVGRNDPFQRRADHFNW